MSFSFIYTKIRKSINKQNKQLNNSFVMQVRAYLISKSNDLSSSPNVASTPTLSFSCPTNATRSANFNVKGFF